MNTKRIMQWVIVLFLLAALPVMTAVLAQGQEPAAKQLPVATEKGESAAPETYNKYESEANNTFATADPMNIGDVMGGVIGSAGDIDYFKFSPAERGYVLIDMEAQSIGSTNLDTVICLYNWAGTLEKCNDDTYSSPDSILFYSSDPAPSPYYVTVIDYANSSGGGDNNFVIKDLHWIFNRTWHITKKVIDGISFQSQDIMAWSELNTGDEKWMMFFDGSDVGVDKPMASFAYQGSPGVDTLIMAFPTNFTIPGLGTATPYHVAAFDFDVAGPDTEGEFTWIHSAWNNADGLSTAGEKIDAFDVTGGAYCWGEYISTTGAAKLKGYWGSFFNQADEDIFVWKESSPFGWDYCFDGSNVPGLAAEDVYALAYDVLNNRMLMTIVGKGNIAGHLVTQKDIFAINFPSYTWGGIVWHGPDHGWNFNIDAFEWTGW